MNNKEKGDNQPPQFSVINSSIDPEQEKAIRRHPVSGGPPPDLRVINGGKETAVSDIEKEQHLIIEELKACDINLIKIELYETDDNLDSDKSKDINESIKQVIRDYFGVLYRFHNSDESDDLIQKNLKGIIDLLGDPQTEKRKWLIFTDLAKQYYTYRAEELISELNTLSEQ
ncbi:MAG: hypothetical protein M1554_02695 [Patescibacteria group bacterium]|jgi:hypothetical protein|nr:hypothetical protein [Patescibacteria group bacterium]